MMEVGGSQINAIEIAARLARRGHSLILFGPDGVLRPWVAELGLEYVLAPDEGRWPSPQNARELTNLVRDLGIDVVHGYEWGPAVDLTYGPHLRLGTPLLTTIMSMEVPDFLSTTARLMVGTRDLQTQARSRYRDVSLLEPPVDLELNRAPRSPEGLRERIGVRRDEVLVSIVSRLEPSMKEEGIASAISAVGHLAQDFPLRLLIVGDGPSRARLEQLAIEANERVGRDVVLIPGEAKDPRPAYSSADIILGMGSSALRGMAFGKPIVVQGVEGFWLTLNPQTAETFLHGGWFGYGEGELQGVQRLTRELLPLLVDAGLREQLGDFGHKLVAGRYGLDDATSKVEATMIAAVRSPPARHAIAASLRGPTLRLMRFKAHMAKHSLQGRLPSR